MRTADTNNRCPNKNSNQLHDVQSDQTDLYQIFQRRDAPKILWYLKICPALQVMYYPDCKNS